MAIQGSFNDIKWQNADKFYTIMYYYKEKVCESMVLCSKENYMTVVKAYKYLNELYKSTCSYFKAKYKDKDEQVYANLKEIKKGLILAEKMALIKSPKAKADLKRKLMELIDLMEETEMDIFLLMKESKLELPLDYNNPSYSIRRQE